MFSRLKKALKAAAIWLMGDVPSENETAVSDMPLVARHTGKGRNKQPHRFSGAAAPRRAAGKRRKAR